ncbi:Ribulose bisphosphate carboxylase/oxygenase activase- chloroplastic [Striga hermonthica]|uniref:Ribulose bisphosphate carboxylase/oxygenase activase- chloroplastic n=1 Tax=Striga hermonthica TaxID=68872 RepID=A0A9N7NQ94_STRHE|nr:Ribulose bisphosphate carboxylase/oxygenase activase- chloroplastic [Striga hermonthica]
MAAAVSTIGAVNRVPALPLNLNGSGPNSSFLGSALKKPILRTAASSSTSGNFFRVVAEIDEKKQTDSDRWKGLVTDISDDQQDITRGKGMTDTLFQAPTGAGLSTHDAVLSSYEYISQGLRQYNFDNTMGGFYIAPAFMDKLIVHISKNFMTLPNIKVPLILGIWGGKGQGKSFQCELVFAKMGINPIMMSAGELESGNAGEPAKLIRQRVYDDEVRKWIGGVGVEKIGSKLVNSREGPPTFEQPKMTLEKLLEYGFMLVQEQENVKRVQLADKYLKEAALGEANKDAIERGTFFGGASSS